MNTFKHKSSGKLKKDKKKKDDDEKKVYPPVHTEFNIHMPKDKNKIKGGPIEACLG